MRDPKAIQKAIMTAKSIASLVDPKFARVPLPNLGSPAPEVYVPEHSPAMHQAFGLPMPREYAAGGDVEDNRAAFLEDNHHLVPHVVYHGTDRNITQFDTEKPRRVDAGGGDTTDTGWYGKGHYFTPSPEAASNFASNYAVTGEHGPNVMPVHLSMKNPFIIKVPRSSSGATEMDRALDKAGAPQSSDERLISKGRGERLPSEQTKILREMGHDGVIVMHQFGHQDEETARRAEERALMAERLHREAADEYYDAFGDHGNPDRLEAAKEAFIRTRRAAAQAREEAGGEYRPAEFVVFEPHQVKSASGNRGTFDRSNPDVRYAAGGEIEGHEVANPMSIFPKPQRMWDEDMPGGAYLSMPDKQDVTGHRASSASIGIGEGGKPYFNASRDPAEVTGSPGRGSATVKTNLFKQKAGWKWLDTPEGHDNTNTLVSVEHRGKHHYVLHAHFPKGVDLARYPDAPSEPRLRPTTKGNVELGPQVGSILVRGKEHPVHSHAIVKAYGGEIEGYADGGAPDDPYTQNPNGGLMFPPEEGAARLETMQRRNALVASGKKPDAGLPKNPRVVIPAPEGSKLPDFVTGNITFDDWRKRHEKILSDDEIHHSSNWYKNIYGNFLKYYPDPQEAKKMMRAWLVAQQNVSPAGAMNNVLMQQEQMERGDPEHLWRAGGMPNPTAAARAVLSGQPIAGGVGQKISDFVDSAEGKSTRSWMGDHPHGGDPFVVDVHTARDTGMIDQELINHLKRVGYDPEQLDKLEIDLKGTPTEAAYENRAQFGRDLTAYLNSMGWKGRNDWTPAEVQAVGWMGMTKLTRNAEEDSESGLGRNLRRISYELSPGEGSPWADKYGEAFESLPDEDRYAITQKMADSAMEHAKKLSGINVHSLVHGTGAWENYQNPAAVAQSLSTQRAADIAAAALGHMLQQTEVWHNRVKPIGASPKGFALDFIERGSKNLADPGALRDFWQKVMDADPHGIVKGYQPITLPSGEVGLRALFDKGGAKAQKAIEDLFAPHQVDKDGNIVQKNPFRAMLEEHPFDLDIMGHEAEITKHRNDWKEQKNGEGYLSRLVDLLGYDPSATLNSARQQLEKEFEQHLDEAHKRKGTTWRKAYGGALKAAPVVGAAMKYLSVNSHHDPSSKMRFARSAMMIAKGGKKK